MKKSEMLRTAAIKVLEVDAKGEFINEFICLYLNRAHGREDKDIENVQQIKKKIYAYLHPWYTYQDYIINTQPIRTKTSPQLIQFMRSKFCIFLAEEYEAMGE